MTMLPLNAIAYIKGLLCALENKNCATLSRFALMSHDSLTRVLNGKGIDWQTLLQHLLLRTFGKLQGGYLLIDDTVIRKQFAKVIEGLSWIFDSEEKRTVLGLNIVLIAWSNGVVTIPLALRLYRKKSGKTKIDLALELLSFCKNVLRLSPGFVAFDSWYAASAVMKRCQRYGWNFVTILKKNRKLDGIPVKKFRKNPYWIAKGKLESGIEVAVVRHGAKYFCSSDLSLSKTEILARYKNRWTIETVFRMLHSKLGLDECESRSVTAQLAHFYLALMTYSILERERYVRKRTIYEIKRQCSYYSPFANELLTRLQFQGA